MKPFIKDIFSVEFDQRRDKVDYWIDTRVDVVDKTPHFYVDMWSALAEHDLNTAADWPRGECAYEWPAIGIQRAQENLKRFLGSHANKDLRVLVFFTSWSA